MYLGRIVEAGPAAQVLTDPQHPYTRDLLAAAPSAHRSLLDDTGDDPLADTEPADPHHPPSGCRYHPRCPIGPLAHPDRTVCVTTDPAGEAAGRSHSAACHFAAGHPTRRSA